VHRVREALNAGTSVLAEGRRRSWVAAVAHAVFLACQPHLAKQRPYCARPDATGGFWIHYLWPSPHGAQPAN
jgi:hypothetical protein